MSTVSVPLTLVFGEARAISGENNFAFIPPRITDDEAFWEFCRRNTNLRIERDADGEVKIMPPSTGFDTGKRNADLIADLVLWNRVHGESGYVTDSSTGFRLPSGATRAPDVAWIRRERIDALTPAQRERFAPLCPDFIIELLSPTDTLTDTQEKMEEYIENGAQLGFLIDAQNRTVYVYRPEHIMETLTNPTEVSATPELPGLILQMARIFPG